MMGSGSLRRRFSTDLPSCVDGVLGGEPQSLVRLACDTAGPLFQPQPSQRHAEPVAADRGEYDVNAGGDTKSGATCQANTATGASNSFSPLWTSTAERLELAHWPACTTPTARKPAPSCPTQSRAAPRRVLIFVIDLGGEIALRCPKKVAGRHWVARYILRI